MEYTPPPGLSAADGALSVRLNGPWGLYTLTYEDAQGKQHVLQAEALLNATGRVPNVHGIGLDQVSGRMPSLTLGGLVSTK